MDIQIGDVLMMKKNHPCGENHFAVSRVGMDFRIRCVGCGREVMVPRAKVEKNIKRVLRDGVEISREALKKPRQKQEENSCRNTDK